MKFKNTIFLLIIALAFNGCKNDKKSNLKRFDLSGNVETVSYIYINASEKFGKAIEDNVLTDSLIKLTFNEKGRLIDSTWNNHKYSKKIEYENDLRKRETFYFNKSKTNFKDFLYTPDGKISEITTYDKNNEISQKKIYKKQEKLSVVKIYNSGGYYIANEQLTYDDNDNLIEISSSKSQTTFKYNNNILDEKIISKTKAVENDCITRRNDYNSFAKVKYVQIITSTKKYDKNGNVSKYTLETHVNPSTIEHNCESYYYPEDNSDTDFYSYHDYDKFKNWTKQIVKSKYGISHIIKRKISYSN